MCKYYENIYHYSSCKDPDGHYLHMSFQGEPVDKCTAGPHVRYVPVPGECHECFPDGGTKLSTTGTGESVRTEHTDVGLPAFFEGYRETEYEEYVEPVDQDDNSRIFCIAWDLPATIEGPQDGKTFLLEALTFTRTECCVKAVSCQEYIQAEYGMMGFVLLENLFSALNSPENCYEDSTMEIYASHDILDVSLVAELSYLRSILLWLCLTFVRPVYGVVSISTATIKHDYTELLLQPVDELDCLLGQKGWCGMFHTAVIVQDPRLEADDCA